METLKNARSYHGRVFLSCLPPFPQPVSLQHTQHSSTLPPMQRPHERVGDEIDTTATAAKRKRRRDASVGHSHEPSVKRKRSSLLRAPRASGGRGSCDSKPSGAQDGQRPGVRNGGRSGRGGDGAGFRILSAPDSVTQESSPINDRLPVEMLCAILSRVCNSGRRYPGSSVASGGMSFRESPRV